MDKPTTHSRENGDKGHRSHRSGHDLYSRSYYKSHLETPVFIAIPLLIWLTVKVFLLDIVDVSGTIDEGDDLGAYLAMAGEYLIALGALSVICLTIAKQYQFKWLFFVSVLAILGMVLAALWNWANFYLVSLFSSSIAGNIPLFKKGIIEGIVSIIMILLYRRQFRHLKMKITYNWYSSATYKNFIRVTQYFFFFLLLFWISGFAVHSYYSGQPYDKIAASKGAALAALVLTIIPALIPLLKPKTEPKSRRHHSQHRRRSSSGTSNS